MRTQVRFVYCRHHIAGRRWRIVVPAKQIADTAKDVALRTYEVCDPVQADSYDVDGIAVSNFVTPLYFAQLPSPTTTRTNYLNNSLDRFGVRPGGYFSYFDLASRKWNNVFGQGAEARVRSKDILGIARRARRHLGLKLANEL